MENPIVSEGQCGCRFEAAAPAHHHRLMDLEAHPLSGLVELIELAATWGELEYDEGEPMIPPRDWIEFAQGHSWADPDRVFDALVALASLAPPAPLASVTPLRPESGSRRVAVNS